MLDGLLTCGEGQRMGAPGEGSGGGGGFGAVAVRQYRNEARERLEDARELRDRLREVNKRD